MALSFRKKKPGTKPIYVVLAILALLIAVTLLTVWLIIGYHRSAPPPEESTDITTQPSYEEPVPGVANCLVILKMENRTNFLLVQTDPKQNRIVTAPIPSTLADEKDTIAQLFERNGSARVAEAVSKALELPVQHYVTLDSSAIHKFLSELDQGVSLKLPQSIHYTDENGLSSTVRSGKRELTATQAVAVLEHDNWTKKAYGERVAADMIASLFNHYLVKDRSIRGYFGSLANLSKTDLRIDHYTAYAPALSQLAENNDGSICSVVILDGKNKGGRFTPNLEDIRRHAGLHSAAKEDDR